MNGKISLKEQEVLMLLLPFRNSYLCGSSYSVLKVLNTSLSKNKLKFMIKNQLFEYENSI